MAVATFYPDGHPESSSVDGYVQYAQGSPAAWSTIRNNEDGSGAFDSDDQTAIIATQYYPTIGGGWNYIRRGICLFDTSSIPDDATILKATFSLFIDSKTKQVTTTSDGIAIVGVTPASNTAIANGDYDAFGSTRYADDIAFDDVQAGYNDFVLNATGLAAVPVDGVTKIGLRLVCDLDDDEPTATAGQVLLYNTKFAEWSEADKRPKLTVVYTQGISKINTIPIQNVSELDSIANANLGAVDTISY